MPELKLFFAFPPIAFTLRSAYNWQLLARFYGNGQAFMILLTHLLDPIQFILYWIALFFNQIWIEYIKFQEKNLDMSEVGEWYLLLLLIVSEICYTPLTLVRIIYKKNPHNRHISVKNYDPCWDQKMAHPDNIMNA